MVLVLEFAGALSLVLAYAGLSRWSVQSWPHVTLNLIGAGLLATVAWSAGSLGFFAINGVWFLVAARSALGLALVARGQRQS